MLWLYRILFIPALVVLGPGYLRRMYRRGGYRENFSHRFGDHPQLPPKGPGTTRVWVQAVSVGEMLAIGPILATLREQGVDIYLTTTTSTGYYLAIERYSEFVIGVGYFPIDWWPFMARAWRRIDPDLAILTEGERWPEHLRQAADRGVPVVGVNFRLSDRSFARLKKFRSGARWLLSGVTRVLPGSAEDEARFIDLGVPRERIVTTGNIKLDVQIPLLDDAQLAHLRKQLGLPADSYIVLGSSTWPGEEEALLETMRRARAAGLKCSLLIVPRHAERRTEIERTLIAAGVRYHIRTRGSAAGEVDVTLADTTGELQKLTQVADLVFVGKSLPPHTEGQTPVEAAALAKPILVGPGMSNFRPIVRDLIARGAAREVATPEELASACVDLLRDPERRAVLAGAAAQWRRDNIGAVQRTLRVIWEEIGRRRTRMGPFPGFRRG
jgi:3-deoxy-D-manno-octulosonic-acid transferase